MIQRLVFTGKHTCTQQVHGPRPLLDPSLRWVQACGARYTLWVAAVVVLFVVAVLALPPLVLRALLWNALGSSSLHHIQWYQKLMQMVAVCIVPISVISKRRMFL